MFLKNQLLYNIIILISLRNCQNTHDNNFKNSTDIHLRTKITWVHCKKYNITRRSRKLNCIPRWSSFTYKIRLLTNRLVHIINNVILCLLHYIIDSVDKKTVMEEAVVSKFSCWYWVQSNDGRLTIFVSNINNWTTNQSLKLRFSCLFNISNKLFCRTVLKLYNSLQKTKTFLQHLLTFLYAEMCLDFYLQKIRYDPLTTLYGMLHVNLPPE